MRDAELNRRAEALGVSTSYLDSARRRVRVDPDTLRAIVAVLEDGASAAAPPGGPGGLGGRAPRTRLPRVPRRQLWGFAIQLYSVRSAKSWGHGDLRDLAELAAWSADELGAGFILVNPLHAAEPVPPVSDSPYLPMSRRFVSPLYLRIEDIAEYPGLSAPDRERIERMAAPLRSASRGPDLIDRDAVWTAKLAALRLIYQARPSAQRAAEFGAFAGREGAELRSWGVWCALAEQHGPDWRAWPPSLRDPGPVLSRLDPAIRAALPGPGPGPGPGPEPGTRPGRAAGGAAPAGGQHQAEPGGDGEIVRRAIFHIWLQWLLDDQLAAAQQAARAAGMEAGVIADLAVGVNPGGADAWARQDLLVSGMSVGAPPDGFNQRGQDWSQPPWHPYRLAAEGYQALAGLFRAACRNAGGIRADHVMGLMRLWWIPEGMTPDRGAYVRYDHHATVGALAGEAGRAGAIAIGEDLGTVDPWIRRYLAARRILGTEMTWFATEPDGSPLRPEHWRRLCIATVGTHDVPPIASFVTGEQVSLRDGLGLLKDPEAERISAKSLLEGWRAALVSFGLLPARRQPSAAEFAAGLYAYLALTPSRLIGVSLADAVGDLRPQNVPGTFLEYPNWRIPLCDQAGSAVLIEDLPGLELVRAVTRAVGSVLAGSALVGSALAGEAARKYELPFSYWSAWS